MPLVSVIVPIYKVEKFLRRCIDSIINQTFSDSEIILVDDGSPDNCPNICDEYKNKDGRIRVIHKENGGLSSARNAGLDIAKGKYVLFVDSDDYIEPNLLKTCVSLIENNNYDAIRFGYKKIDNEYKKIWERYPAECLYSFKNSEEKLSFLRDFLLSYKIPFTAWSCLFKNEIIQKYHLRFYSERIIFSEDTFFSTLYTFYSNNCFAIDKIFYIYQDNVNSLMRTYKSENQLLINKCIRWSKELYKQCNDEYLRERFYVIATAFYKNELPFNTRPKTIKHIKESAAAIEDKEYFSNQYKQLLNNVKSDIKSKVGFKQSFKELAFIKFFISYNRLVFNIKVLIMRILKI